MLVLVLFGERYVVCVIVFFRRKDVMTVVTELEPSRLEESISSMRKRLDKHCSSGDEEVESDLNVSYICTVLIHH